MRSDAINQIFEQAFCRWVSVRHGVSPSVTESESSPSGPRVASLALRSVLGWRPGSGGQKFLATHGKLYRLFSGMIYMEFTYAAFKGEFRPIQKSPFQTAFSGAPDSLASMCWCGSFNWSDLDDNLRLCSYVCGSKLCCWISLIGSPKQGFGIEEPRGLASRCTSRFSPLTDTVASAPHGPLIIRRAQVRVRRVLLLSGPNRGRFRSGMGVGVFAAARGCG